MKLGEFIVQYRRLHDLSQRQFALQCGLSNGYISMLERGINPATQNPVTPTLPQLKKLANGMGLTMMELFEEVEDIPIDIHTVTEIARSGLIQSMQPGIRLTVEEKALVQKYRRLDARGRSAVMNVLDHELATAARGEAGPAAKKA